MKKTVLIFPFGSKGKTFSRGFASRFWIKGSAAGVYRVPAWVFQTGQS